MAYDNGDEDTTSPGHSGEKGRTFMEIKEGDIFKNNLDEAEYIVKKIVNRMVVLESENPKRHILTEVSTLNIKSFYQKMT